MQEANQVESEITVRGERCKVAAVKKKSTWEASGTMKGTLITINKASSSKQAFEWWTNKAQMQQRD